MSYVIDFDAFRKRLNRPNELSQDEVRARQQSNLNFYLAGCYAPSAESMRARFEEFSAADALKPSALPQNNAF